MTNKKETFNYLPWVVGALAIVAILLIIRNTDKKPKAAVENTQAIKSTEKAEDPSADSLSKEVKEEKVASVAFLALNDEEIDSLPTEMAELYREIIGTQNFASGISILPVMEALNSLINKEFDKYEIKAVAAEEELLENMQALKVNPRVTAGHLNKAGRITLQKLYLLQEKAYPRLANQLREIKAALGDVPSSGSLQGYGFKVKEFFDEAFVFFYLAWENEQALTEN